MEKIVGILGAIQIVGGVLVYANAASAIHQILGRLRLGSELFASPRPQLSGY